MNERGFPALGRVFTAERATAADIATLFSRVSQWLQSDNTINVQDVATSINDERAEVTVYYIRSSW